MQTDADAIACSLHDTEAFGVVYERHVHAIYDYLARRADRAAAEDLLCDVFVRAFRKRSAYDGERADARPWLYGIASNVLREHFRTSARHRRLAVPGAEPEHHDDGYERVEDALAADGDAARVRVALRRLPEREQEVLTLLAWEGLDYADIAEALDLPIGTVRSRIHRGRARLRELLGSESQVQGKASCGGRNHDG